MTSPTPSRAERGRYRAGATDIDGAADGTSDVSSKRRIDRAHAMQPSGPAWKPSRAKCRSWTSAGNSA